MNGTSTSTKWVEAREAFLYATKHRVTSAHTPQTYLGSQVNSFRVETLSQNPFTKKLIILPDTIMSQRHNSAGEHLPCLHEVLGLVPGTEPTTKWYHNDTENYDGFFCRYDCFLDSTYRNAELQNNCKMLYSELRKTLISGNREGLAFHVPLFISSNLNSV